MTSQHYPGVPDPDEPDERSRAPGQKVVSDPDEPDERSRAPGQKVVSDPDEPDERGRASDRAAGTGT